MRCAGGPAESGHAATNIHFVKGDKPCQVLNQSSNPKDFLLVRDVDRSASCARARKGLFIEEMITLQVLQMTCLGDPQNRHNPFHSITGMSLTFFM
jgi:hypothetical protein